MWTSGNTIEFVAPKQSAGHHMRCPAPGFQPSPGQLVQAIGTSTISPPLFWRTVQTFCSSFLASAVS